MIEKTEHLSPGLSLRMEAGRERCCGGGCWSNDFGMPSRDDLRRQAGTLSLANDAVAASHRLRSAKMLKVSRRAVAVRRAEDNSSCARLAPSTGFKARTVS
jgi:hypothetical protein